MNRTDGAGSEGGIMKRFFGFSLVVGLVMCLFVAGIPGAETDGLTVTCKRDRDFKGRQADLWGVELTFNLPVFASELTKFTKVTIGDKKHTYVVQNLEKDKSQDAASRRFRIVGQRPPKDAGAVKISVEKGLADATGRKLLAEDFSYLFSPQLEKVVVTGYESFYRLPDDKGLRLRFSSDVSAWELRGAFKVTPEVPNLQVAAGPYSRSLVLRGDFEYGREYVLEISPEKAEEGAKILEARSISFKGPGIPPEIRIKTQRDVVELRSRQLVPLSVQMVNKVRATLKGIPPYLVPEAADHLKAKGNLDAWAGQERLGAMRKLIESGRIPKVFGGDFPEDSEVFFVDGAARKSARFSMPMSFRKNPDRGRALAVTLVDPDGGLKTATSRLLQVTDLSVSYKISAKTLLLWVTSIYGGDPVSGVDVLLYTHDAQRFIVGKTDKDGLLRIQDGAEFPAVRTGRETSGVSKQPLTIRKVKWAVAATDSDCAAVPLDSFRLKPFSTPQTSKPEAEPDVFRGYIFTERGIYRPGEKVHFKCVVRAYKNKKIVSPTGKEVEVAIIGPKNDVIYSSTMPLSEFGSCYDSFKLKSFLPVGTYTIEARMKGSEGDKDSNAFKRTFLVQEYKRPRHFVALKLSVAKRTTEEYITLKREIDIVEVNVGAEYYAGGPVKHAKVRWKATLVPAKYDVKGFENFFFGNESDDERFVESGESILDKNGKLLISIPMERSTFNGLYRVKVSATVLDVDGEPATDVATFSPKPRFMVGVSTHPDRVQSGYSSSLKVIVLDKDGKPVPSGELSVGLLKMDHFSTLKRDEEGNLNYSWDEGWLKAASSTVSITDGAALYDVEFNEFGRFMLAFSYKDESGEYTSQTTFKVGWEEYDRWWRQRTDEAWPTTNEVMPVTTKKEYRIGDEVTVEFSTRRPLKKCLVALEAGDIIDYNIIDVNGTKGVFTFKAAKEHQPNVYVSIIGAAGRDEFPLLRTQTDTDIPTVYFGYARVAVRSDIQALNVKIDPERSQLKGRPGEKASLRFKVTDAKGKGVISELAVCVVDEAVLALTRYVTPDLSTLNDFTIPLSVFSGDLRMDLISQDLFRILSTKPLTGGGMGPGFISPSIRKDFRPVAYFNPALTTDKSGEVSIEFTLPDTTTKYRVYAVACDKGSGFASAQRDMVVAKEFFVEPSVPRFLAPGDRVGFPVVVYNQSGAEGSATLEAEASKGSKISLSKAFLELEPDASSVVQARLDLLSGGEDARVLVRGKFKGKAGEFSDAIEKPIPILSRYIPATVVYSGSTSTKTDIAARLPAALKTLKPEDINPNDFKAYITLSATNWNRIAPGLKYLLHYPYGCIEQTSSGLIPLSGMRALAEVKALLGIGPKDVDKFLQGGVKRLLSMQLDNGGFAYWPGQSEVTWWGTLYATFALTVARQNGFDVPEARLKAALDFIRQSLFGRGSHHLGENRRWTKELALYSLAMNDMLKPAELEPFFEDFDAQDEQAKALLVLCAKKTGYRPPDELAKMTAKLKPVVDPARRDYYNSSFRTIAMCLLANLEAGGAVEQADKLAGALLTGLKPEGRWHSTADTGWCLFALARYFKGKDPGKVSPIPVKVSYAGEAARSAAVAEASVQMDIDPYRLLSKGRITLESSKKELVNYTLTVTYPDVSSDPAELGRGFTLSKTIENLSGKKETHVGDVVRVTVTIGIPMDTTKGRSLRVEYLALEDPVPAGLVPINSELETEGYSEGKSRGEHAPWRHGYYEFRPNYSEFRDDGVRVFKNRAWTGSYRYTYLARAVMEGDFWMRGSRISLMYDPDVFGKTLGRKVTILPPEK